MEVGSFFFLLLLFFLRNRLDQLESPPGAGEFHSLVSGSSKRERPTQPKRSKQ
jgi:hypothetical protein